MRPRPPPSSPIHSLLDKLRDLQVLLDQPRERIKVLEAYETFIRINRKEKPRECTYALKCEKIFREQLYPEVKKLIREINSIIEEMENK